MEKDEIKLSAMKIVKILLGAAIFAMGIQWFYHPAKLLSGGITGVALILNYVNPHLRVGVMMIALNVPLFAIAWKHYGWRFIAGSLLGMLSCSLLIDFLSGFRFDFTQQPILAALYGVDVAKQMLEVHSMEEGMTLAGFIIVYSLLGLLDIILLVKNARKGPAEEA